MADFIIYQSGTTTARTTVKKLKRSGSFGKPAYIEMEISSPTPIAFAVGDYLDYRGFRYKLYTIPQPDKQAASGTYGAAFVYRSVQLYAATKDLEIAIFRDIVLGSDVNNIHYTSLPNVDTYENIHGIANRIQANMDALYPGQWRIEVVTTTDTDLQAVFDTPYAFSLSDGTCLGALDLIYNTWKYNGIGIGWVHTMDGTTNVITIGRPSIQDADNTTGVFSYGKGNGLKVIKKEISSINDIATRLFVYGNSTNMPARYYNQQFGSQILNNDSIYIPNLMIPVSDWGTTNGKKDAGKAFLDATNEAKAKWGIRPKVIRFDGSGDYEDIHPSIEGATAKNIRDSKTALSDTTNVPDSTIYPDTERMDEVKGVTNPTDNGVLSQNSTDIIETIEAVQAYSSTQSGTPTIDNYYVFYLDNLYSAEITETGKITLKLSDSIFKVTPEANISKIKMQAWIYVDNKRIKQIDARAISRNYPYEFFEGETDADITTIGNLNVRGWVAVYFVSGQSTCTLEVTAQTAIWERKRTLDSKKFLMVLKQIGFDISKQATTETRQISMKDGMCGGRTFDITNVRYRQATDDWELTCAREEDTEIGQYFPNSIFPINGRTDTDDNTIQDHFVLLGFEMPKLYVELKSSYLKTEGQKLLGQFSKQQHIYTPEIDSKQMQVWADANNGRTLAEGMYFNISDSDVVDEDDNYVLIDSVTIEEESEALPKYSVTLRDEKRIGRKERESKATARLTKIVSEAKKTVTTKSADDTETKSDGGSGTFDHSELVNRDYNDQHPISAITGLRAALDSKLEELDIIKTTDSTEASDTNVYSALKSKEEDELRILKEDIIISESDTAAADTNVYSALKSKTEDEKRLRKDTEDTAAEKIKFSKGAEFGTFVADDTGANVDAEGNAQYQIIKALVKLLTSEAGNTTFSSGVLGSGWKIWIDNDGKSHFECDDFLSRRTAHFIEVMIDKLRGVGGNYILSPAMMDVIRVVEESTYYRCYFKQDDGSKSTDNEFAVGDLARSQTFNIKEGTSYNVSNKYYWRQVIAVGADYIDLSKTLCDTGSGAPEAGDGIVQLGNISDTTRQSAIILSAYGSDAPSIKQYVGINSYDLTGKDKQVISPSFNKFTGKFIFSSNNEDAEDYVNTQIEILAGNFTSQFSELEGKSDTMESNISASQSLIQQHSDEILLRVTTTTFNEGLASTLSAAEEYALAKANLAETTSKAYADGIVDEEEERAIADAQAKADAAEDAAIAAAATDATTKANAAKTAAIAAAAIDATTKSSDAETAAKTYADTKDLEIKSYTDAQIEVLAGSITSTVSELKGLNDNLQEGFTASKSEIQQNADSIKLRVTTATYNAEKAELTDYLNTQIEILAGSITSEVSELSGNMSTIKQTADSISAKIISDEEGLLDTGIDITKKKVVLTANTFRIQSNIGAEIAVFKLDTNGNPVLKAENIDADNLLARRIRTSDSGKRVVIENNILAMYDDSENMRMKVSGEVMGAGGASTTINIAGANGDEIGSIGVNASNSGYQTMSTFNVSASNNNVYLPAFSLYAQCTGHTSRAGTAGLRIWLLIDYTVIGELSTDNSASGESYLSIPASNRSLGVGDHTLRLQYSWYKEYEAAASDILEVEWSAYANNSATGLVSYNSEMVEVGSNGMRAMFGSDYVFEAKKENGAVTLSMQAKKASTGYMAGIRVTSAGVQINRGAGAGWQNL